MSEFISTGRNALFRFEFDYLDLVELRTTPFHAFAYRHDSVLARIPVLEDKGPSYLVANSYKPSDKRDYYHEYVINGRSTLPISANLHGRFNLVLLSGGDKDRLLKGCKAINKLDLGMMEVNDMDIVNVIRSGRDMALKRAREKIKKATVIGDNLHVMRNGLLCYRLISRRSQDGRCAIDINLNHESAPKLGGIQSHPDNESEYMLDLLPEDLEVRLEEFKDLLYTDAGPLRLSFENMRSFRV